MGRQSQAIGAAMRREVEQACKALVLEINRELRKSGSGTPVDTGHARANWVPSIGVPFEGEVGARPAGGRDSGGRFAGNSENAAGVAAVMRFKLGDGVLYLSNNVPYINRLNYGHSKQAPRLFIEACVDRALATIQARYDGRVGFDRASVLGSTAGGQEYLGAESAGNLADAYSPFGD